MAHYDSHKKDKARIQINGPGLKFTYRLIISVKATSGSLCRMCRRVV